VVQIEISTASRSAPAHGRVCAASGPPTEAASPFLVRVKLGLLGFHIFDELVEPIDRFPVIDREGQPAMALDLLF